MTQLLHINASPRGRASHSLRIAQAFLASCQDNRPDLKMDSFNLFDESLPPCDVNVLTAKDQAASGGRMSGAVADSWAQVQPIFDRFTSADYYLFNIPMWNFGVPYVVKQFVDIVTHPGLTFRLSASTGYSGMLRGKRACVIYTSGVYFPGCGPEFGSDFQSTYLTRWLRFIGVEQVEEIHLHRTNFAPNLGTEFARACDKAKSLALAV